MDYVFDYSGQYWPNQSDVTENPCKRDSVQKVVMPHEKEFYSKQSLRDDKQMSRRGGQRGKEETNNFNVTKVTAI